MAVRDDERGAESLLARLGDLCALAKKGEVAISAFLSPSEQNTAQKFLKQVGAIFFLEGGYPDSERRRVYILPDYMEYTEGADAFELLSDFGFSPRLSYIRVMGSGYVTLSHRDYLGAVLGLGLTRDVIGDILLLGNEEREAVIICDEVISPYILEDMTFVARDKVRAMAIHRGDFEAPKRKTQPIHDTVASERLDAVVAALCNISRDRAKELVTGGLAELDFEREERPDRALTAPCTVSLRGFGRFRVLSLGGKTKKGRLRLEAEKFI